MFTKKSRLMLGLVLTSFVLSQAVAPKRAEALVSTIAGVTLVPAAIIIGAGVVIGGSGVVAISGFGDKLSNGIVDGFTYGIVATPTGMGLFLLGILVLDETGSPTNQLKALSEAKAAELGISASERRALNRQLPQVNALMATTLQQAADEKNTSSAELMKISHDNFAEARASHLLSEATYSAISKVSNGLSKAAAQN